MNRPLPPALWISLIALGVISLIQLAVGVGIRDGRVLLGVLVNLVVMYGLYRAARWAFVLTLVFGILGVLFALTRGPVAGFGVLIGNAIVVVPLVLARAYFFPPLSAPASEPRYCPQCGRPLTAPPTPNCSACHPMK